MEYLIEVENLNKSYPEFSLKNVSFKVPGGCIMGLIGENGAGKSTTIKSILDLVHADSGKIRIFGKDIYKKGKEIREDIGVVLDGTGFHETLKAREVGKFMGKIYKNWDEKYYQRLLKTLEVPGNKKLKEFSTGMRMKLMIVAAMAHHPKLLILDEATSGLDPVVRDEILDMFQEFIQDEEHSVLISSHITSDLEKVADYITFIHKGEIFLSEEKDRIMEEYGIIRCRPEDVSSIDGSMIIGISRGTYSCDVLVSQREKIKQQHPNFMIDRIKLEDVLLFKVKGDK